MVAIVSLLASCTSRNGSPAGEPALGPIPTPHTAADLVLPLDPYKQSVRDYVRIQRAAWLLTRDCVRRFGGDYTLPESAVLANVPGFDTDNDRRYGLFDAEAAAARGYNVPEAAGADGGGEDQRRWNPSETELLLVRGGNGAAPTDSTGKPLPSGGCSGEATRALENGVPAPPNERLGNELSIDSHARSEADSRVRTAMAAWSECMAGSGFTYTSIWEPNDQAWPTVAGDAEIATAKADVACKLKTNLVGTWLAVESAYQKRALEANAQPLGVLKAYVQAQARNAARVVGG